MSAIYRDEGAALRASLEVELSVTRERVAALRARLGASTPALDRLARRMLRPAHASASVSELAARVDATREKNARLDLDRVVVETEAKDLPPPEGLREGKWPPIALVSETWRGHLHALSTEQGEALLDALWALLDDTEFSVWDDLEMGVPVHYLQGAGARFVLGTDGARCGGVVTLTDVQEGLSLEPRPLASAVREFVGWSQDAQLGHPEFDDAFDIAGSVRWAMRVCTAEVREALLRFGGPARVRMRVAGCAAALAWEGAPTRESMRLASRLLIALAERGERNRM